MADIVQDNVKEKVSAVREVVSGKSNNEIILVLQYYDYDVEKAIQAYVEDGAKSALTDWHFTGPKAPKKKNKKKKQQQQQPPPQNGPKSPASVSSESSVKTNGDIGDQRQDPPLVNGILHIENDISKVSTVTTIISDDPRPSSPTLSEMSSVSGSHVIENGATEVKVLEVVEPEPHPQHPHNHNNHRQRNHSGSHSHGHGHKHDHDRNRTISSSSGTDDAKARAKRTAHGLEKSVKDLHRQTVSLERLKLVFSEEVEKGYKRIRTVFDEIRNCLNAREVELMQEMGCVKAAADDTFTMRQKQAAELKVKIDRADRLDDSQLADLRADIKHFVSDRKVDEDLGRTTRFLYDDDHLKDEVKKFGEIVPVKCSYGNPHRSVSMTSDPDHHLPESPAVDISVRTAFTASTTTHTTEKPNVPHLDPSQAHEVAELQRRLKNSLTLEGIAVETYPDRPMSAPVNTDDQMPKPVRPESAYNRNRNNRNRRRPQDQGRDRPRDNRNGPNDGRDNRQIYNQSQAGERVILIGRGTRPQGGQSRPPRGGRGRGGYGGRGRGNNPGGYSGAPREESAGQETGDKGDNSTTQESKSAPPRGQRSPRRSGGRGRGAGRGGGASSAASASSISESQDNQSKNDNSSHTMVNPGSKATGQ